MVKLDRFVGSCNTFDNLSNKLCVPNKTEDLNKYVFSYDYKKIELKILTKAIWCKCKCKFAGRKCYSNQKWNNYNYKYESQSKKHPICEKNYSRNLTACSCENVNI